MPDEYSIYNAKAKLSALVRQVREGRSFVITVNGEPVAELRPIDRSAAPQPLRDRISELQDHGVISPARGNPSDPATFRVGAHVPGALERFLTDRE